MQAVHRRGGLNSQAAGLLLAALSCLAPVAAEAVAPPPGARAIVAGGTRSNPIDALEAMNTVKEGVFVKADVDQDTARIPDYISHSGDYPVKVHEIFSQPLTPDSLCEDVLVNVQEAITGSLMFGGGVNSSRGVCGSIITNERNFDLSSHPAPTDSQQQRK